MLLTRLLLDEVSLWHLPQNIAALRTLALRNVPKKQLGSLTLGDHGSSSVVVLLLWSVPARWGIKSRLGISDGKVSQWGQGCFGGHWDHQNKQSPKRKALTLFVVAF